MNTLILLILVALIFGLLPPLGLVMLMKDVVDSRSRGREFDAMVKGLRMSLEVPGQGDIAHALATALLWLEDGIRSANAQWVRASYRLLIQLSVIGLGEQTRGRLMSEPEYRDRAVASAHELVDSIEHGQMKETLQAMGGLYALFQCGLPSVRDDRAAPSLDPVPVVCRALRSCSALLGIDIFEADEVLTSGLRTVAEQSDCDHAGLPLLILHWAKIRMWQEADRPNSVDSPLMLILSRSDRLPDQLLRVAKSYSVGDLVTTAEMICGSL